MNSLIAFFMSVVVFFTNLLGFGGTQIKEISKAEDFTPVLRFMVCSDTHINALNDRKCQMVQKAVDFCYREAQKDNQYQKLDAVMFVGDLTDNGTVEQFEAFNTTVNNALKDETRLLAVVAKNHDSSELDKESLNIYSSLTGNDTDFHVVINGYHFIGISTSKYNGNNYGLYQRIWLEKQLAQAAKDDPEKPIFVCHHEHVKNTVYGSSDFEGWGKSFFRDIFNRYPQIVHFSGHSHYPLNDPRSVWQGEFTAVGTGAIAYMELTVDSDRSLHPENHDKTSQAWLVEVGADNTVRLKGFDVTNEAYLCEYDIINPSDKTGFVYTPENLAAHSTAPAFDKASVITVLKTENGYQATFPTANSTDDKIIFLYRYTVTGQDGKTTDSGYFVNNYWSSTPEQTITVDFKANPGDTLSITAENAYEMQSSPITVTVQ